jgi:hypothetical protein
MCWYVYAIVRKHLLFDSHVNLNIEVVVRMDYLKEEIMHEPFGCLENEGLLSGEEKI